VTEVCFAEVISRTYAALAQAREWNDKRCACPTIRNSFDVRKTLYGGRSACQTSTMGHPPRIPVRLRWEQSVIYFVTICVKDRKQVLANEAAFNALKNAAARLRE
jgi:hypothetical protein